MPYASMPMLLKVGTEKLQTIKLLSAPMMATSSGTRSPMSRQADMAIRAR